MPYSEVRLWSLRTAVTSYLHSNAMELQSYASTLFSPVLSNDITRIINFN